MPKASGDRSSRTLGKNMKHPDYDKSKFTVWALPHPLVLHRILNPGLAFNELILGQRLPKVLLIDKTSNKPLIERTYVPCPYCGTQHDGRLWAKWNAFGHWFGFVCPTCEKIIPCLWNVFSIVLLVVTSPLWFLPANYLRPKWIEYEKKRLNRNQDQQLIEVNKGNLILRGTLMFGGAMWIAMSVASLIIKILKGQKATWTSIWMQLPIWLFAGLIWALVMQVWMNKKGKKVEQGGAFNIHPPGA